MKNIKLTEKHKSKLLEMSKVLFFEYEWDFSFLKREGNIKYWDNKIKNAKFIHWFEFCMTHLADKMIELGELPSFNNKLDYEFFSILQSSLWESHPIDYLYEEFKKLK